MKQKIEPSLVVLGASSGAAEHRGAFCHRAARGTESCNHGTCATVTAKTPAGRPFLVPMLLTGSWKDRVSSVECGREGVAGILKRLGPGSLRCEYHNVKGGVLADAIGYGKTACTIGLVDKTKARLSRLPSSPRAPPGSPPTMCPPRLPRRPRSRRCHHPSEALRRGQRSCKVRCLSWEASFRAEPHWSWFRRTFTSSGFRRFLSSLEMRSR